MPKSVKTTIPYPARDNSVIVAMAVIMLLAIALRLYNLGKASLWFDEYLTLTIASGTVESIPQAVRAAEQTPPLFHFFMHFWINSYGDSEFSMRFPAALCGIGAVWMIYRLASLLYSRREGCIAAMLTALSAFQIAYSQEARVYAPLMLVALISSYFFVKMIMEGGLKNQVGYVLATGLLYWIHLHSVFIVAVQQIAWVYLWLMNRKKSSELGRGETSEPSEAKNRPRAHALEYSNEYADRNHQEFKLPPVVWASCTLIALSLFIPWIPTVLYWVNQARQAFWIGPMTAGFVPSTYSLYTGSAIMLAILLILSIWGAIKTPQRWKMIFLIALLIAPVMIPYVVSLLIRPLFIPRYGIAAATGLYILAARGCTALPGRAAQTIAAALLLIVSAITVYPHLHDGPPDKPDVRTACETVIHDARSGDAILLNSYANSILVHYLRTDTSKYRMTYETKDLPAAGSVEPGTRLWVLSMRGPDGKYSEAYKELASKLGWQWAEMWEFHGVFVERFVRE